ncbi:MAG: ribosome recycling factor [Oscillospiraceae bacterium]|jgi:ribosome recycling factor|nr:ribosome recycling factor [Oscillospiraceae bacterium]
MVKDIIETAKAKMGKTADVLRNELMAIRAGRANPQLLDRISVDYYGTMTPLTQMANITAPEPRLLVISLWDVKALPAVEKAILKSDLGLNPTNDGKVIRLALPELTEERRRDLTKVVRKSTEDAKVAIRAIRRDAIEQLKKLKKDSGVPEDEEKKAEDDMQKLTDNAIKDLDRICADKEKEIMDVR